MPTMALGRLHTKAAVIDESIVYIGSVNLDPRSGSTNTELGMLAECPELAKAGHRGHRHEPARKLLSAALRR